MDTKLISKIQELVIGPRIKDVERSPTKDPESPPLSATEEEEPAQLYTMAEVSNHCEFHDCWVVIWDRVYNISEFIREHPGGEDVLLENAGRDATIPFMEVGHSKDALSIMKSHEIGMLVPKERIIKRKRYETC